MFTQLVEPNLNATAPAGSCLAFAQKVYNAPVMHPTAWDAWEATTMKREGSLPPVSVPVWFDHWGTYNGVKGQYGHVVAWIPSRGFLSSPASGNGQQWLNTIGEVESVFNSKYVGWSLDINTLQVATESPTPTIRKNKEMFVVRNSATNQTFTVGNQYIKHEQDATRAAIVCTALMGGPQNALTFDQFGFDVFCDSMGIPRNTGAGLIPGKTWSRQQDILNKV